MRSQTPTVDNFARICCCCVFHIYSGPQNLIAGSPGVSYVKHERKLLIIFGSNGWSWLYCICKTILADYTPPFYLHTHTHKHAHTHTHTDTYTNTVYTHYAAICPTLECRSLIENCHNAAPRSASAAVWETSQRQQLLKYSPPKPSSSLATAQYTVVAAPCC